MTSSPKSKGHEREAQLIKERREAYSTVMRTSRELGDACLIRFVGPSGVAELEIRNGKFRAKPKQRRTRRQRPC